MEAHRIRDRGVKDPIPIVLDTNFLMVPGLFRVDIQSEIRRLVDVDYKLVVPDKVLLELKTISKKGDLSSKKAARIGLELSRGMEVVKMPGHITDDALYEFSKEGWIVCTNDKELKKRIIDEGGSVIYLRRGGFLELRGGVIGLS